MTRFTISPDPCTTGFYEHVHIKLDLPVSDQLHRRRLFLRQGIDQGSSRELIKIIGNNSSLRVAFGWSFESAQLFQSVMQDCITAVRPAFVGDIVSLTSDNRCDWVGFTPFNTFDQIYYENLCIEDLIFFNNNLIKYQTSIIEHLVNHPVYRFHAILRDDNYRFKYFKEKRKDSVALGEAFQYYVDAVQTITGSAAMPRFIIEEMIGCHYLYNPDVFFELLEFFKLKGVIYE